MTDTCQQRRQRRLPRRCSLRRGLICLLLSLTWLWPTASSGALDGAGGSGTGVGVGVDVGVGVGVGVGVDVGVGVEGRGGGGVTPIGVWPLRPEPDVLRRFDLPAVRWGSGHRGADLAGSEGQSVHAALGGTVSFVGSIAGVGIVVVSHGATRTTYQPVSATVSPGQVVTPGERIGTLRLIGGHCVPRVCLHWGWLRGSVYLDPLLMVGGPKPVRLWPWASAGASSGASSGASAGASSISSRAGGGAGPAAR